MPTSLVDVGGLPQIQANTRRLKRSRANTSQSRGKQLAGWIVGGCGVVLLALCGGMIYGIATQEPHKEDERDRQYEVRRLTKAIVMDAVKSPSTAEFGDLRVVRLTDNKTGDNIYYVDGWIDAQNTFGGTVRTDFKASWAHNEAGEFRLLDIMSEQR